MNAGYRTPIADEFCGLKIKPRGKTTVWRCAKDACALPVQIMECYLECVPTTVMRMMK